MTIEPKISKARKVRFVAPFDLLIPASRPSKGVHPKVTVHWVFHHKHAIKVNEDSGYLEFAWECLRRNRYYMALVDKKGKTRPDTEWGYQWHKDVPRSHGLMELKPYTEGYNEGSPPRWVGLDSFAESFPTTASLETITVPITLKPGQVAIIYDLGGHFGDSPWSAQTFTTHIELRKLAKKLYSVEGLSFKDKHKKILLRRLAMFDSISSGQSIQFAAQKLLGERARTKRVKAGEVARLFPSEEHKTSTTAYDDADAAYDLIYRHGYIKLIGAEHIYKFDGNRMRTFTPEELNDKNEFL
jgi:hypothetical protein